MDFKPTIKQAVGLALLRGYSIDSLTKNMTPDEITEFTQVVELVKGKLSKSGYKGYNAADNVRRKLNNLETGKEANLPQTMNRVKEYGGSGPSGASKEAVKAKSLSAKNHTIVRGADGKAIDVIHSSGRNRGKSVHKTPEEKAKALAEINGGTK